MICSSRFVIKFTYFLKYRLITTVALTCSEARLRELLSDITLRYLIALVLIHLNYLWV